MALQADPPHTGDIGDHPEDEPLEWGERVDRAYEEEMELRGERPPE